MPSSAPGQATAPPEPAAQAALAAEPDGAWDALVVSAATLTIDQVTSGGRAWRKAQMIRVPIQYGSSG
ncbi:MAG: hypothetical protein JWM19_4442 [Actinomycetia bacterium]|nr:hypothetical protein [Actinomycetes bacterium]